MNDTKVKKAIREIYGIFRKLEINPYEALTVLANATGMAIASIEAAYQGAREKREEAISEIAQAIRCVIAQAETVGGPEA